MAVEQDDYTDPVADNDRSYRGGVHQAIAMCRRWADECDTLDDVKHLLAGAEAEAGSRRHSPERQDFLLDMISERVHFPWWVKRHGATTSADDPIAARDDITQVVLPQLSEERQEYWRQYWRSIGSPVLRWEGGPCVIGREVVNERGEIRWTGVVK
jgi:hypothetical protein